jgi:hypothetical protein
MFGGISGFARVKELAKPRCNLNATESLEIANIVTIKIEMLATNRELGDLQ